MPVRRPRHQVVLVQLPGSEPWYRVQRADGAVVQVPGTCSLDQLWERLSGASRTRKNTGGELLVLVPLGDVLTVGGVRERQRRRRDQVD